MMFMSRKRCYAPILIAFGSIWSCATIVKAQPMAFTYQGQLKDAGTPAIGDFDLTFRLFDAESAGNQIGGDVALVGVAVTDGLFTAELDFGWGVFDGAPRWLEIEVNGETLAPRQAITSAPYAQRSDNTYFADYSSYADGAGYAYAPWLTSGLDLYYTDGNVGIGTVAPTAKLEIAGEPGVDGVKFPDGSLQTTAAIGGGDSVWSLNGVSTYYNAGNVGIGRASPAFKLDVNSSSGFGARIGMQAAGGGALVVASNPGDNRVYLEAYNSTDNGSATEMLITGYAGGVLPQLQISATKVGIGTAVPSAKLHVRNTGLFSGGDAVFGETTAHRGVVGRATDLAGIAGQFTNTAGGVALKADGSLVVEQSGAGAELLRLNTERPWAFKQAYTGSGTALRLQPDTGLKSFEIVGAGGTVVATFWANDADPQVIVNGKLITKVLQITGADLAENFPTSGDKVEPGTVMEIDPDNPGRLRMAREAYNQRVAGVVSGANDFPAGAILGNLPGSEDATPIALSGRVWTYCDAGEAAIAPGDLLTTSATAGHAMKAADRDRAHGAVIGKAMTSLESGRGLVLVLVNLQ
jgi:hypothetical protein